MTPFYRFQSTHFGESAHQSTHFKELVIKQINTVVLIVLIVAIKNKLLVERMNLCFYTKTNQKHRNKFLHLPKLLI